MFEHTKQGAIDVIRSDESLTHERIEPLLELLAECRAHGQPRIVFDLEQVSLIDSAGLEMLIDAREQCLARGGSMKLAAPNPLCRDIFLATGLDEQFEVFPNVVLAAGSFVR